MTPDNLTRDLFAGVNEVRDPGNLTDLERKHIPAIRAPAAVARMHPFDVTVEVGAELGHPGERLHFIEFIDLYADEALLARVSLTAAAALPSVTLRVVLARPAKRLRALARCNVHGVWAGETPISVTG